ncbi:MAG TPA: class I SAM-dependent methyltransferase, partial [Actinomycetota bacterium]
MVRDLHGSIRDWWDADAHHYDRSVGHAISDPVEAAAWRAALRRFLPAPPSRVLDVGAGTGSLSLLAAELGHEVTALDLSEGMLDRARRKAEERGSAISFVVGAA